VALLWPVSACIRLAGFRHSGIGDNKSDERLWLSVGLLGAMVVFGEVRWKNESELAVLL